MNPLEERMLGNSRSRSEIHFGVERSADREKKRWEEKRREGGKVE